MGKIFFDQPVKNNNKTYENIRKIATCQVDDCTTGCLLDYAYLRDYYKMIAIDLSKQQALSVNRRAIQHINFTTNLDCKNNKRIIFTLKEVKGTVSDFSQRTVKVL